MFSRLSQFGCVVLLVMTGGCVAPPLRYLEAGDSPPPDFAISLPEAYRIARMVRWKKTRDDFYCDDRNYYVVDGFMDINLKDWVRGRASTAEGALERGLIINGQTGEIYNRETYQWESAPQLLRSDHESESDLQAREFSRY